MSYPFVSERASPADCYIRKPQLAQLPQKEKEKVLVGIHDTQQYTSMPGPASIFGNPKLLIAAPTEQNYMDKPGAPSITDNARPPSSSTAIKRLGMTNKWSMAFAIPLCLMGFLYLKWANKPKFLMKWNFELVKGGLIPVVTVEAKIPEPLMQITDSPVTIIPAAPEQEPTGVKVEVPGVPDPEVGELTTPTPEIAESIPGEDKTVEGKILMVDVIHISQETLEDSQVSVIEEIVPPSPFKSEDKPEVLKADENPEPSVEVNLQIEEALVESKVVRFQEERPKTPAPEVSEDTESPTTPTTPTPKKRKAHRGQRGGKNKKKASKAQQQADENDEIGRIVDRAKDLQQSLPTLQPDVQVLNDPADIDSDIIRIDNLEVHQDPASTLGLGSQGTVVFKGKFEGRAVAVKRMLKTFFDVAHREVKLLQDSDDHPNVIRYHCMKELDQFLYIALEQCRASLCDVIVEAKHEELRSHLNPQEVLRQIVAGVNHLHQMKIVHRDLKPQNILVSEPKRFPRDPSKLQHPRILISDFGLCKQLEANQSSFRATTAHAAGTSGWRAPELLMEEGSDMRPFSSSALSETSGGSSTETALFDGLTNRRATRSIDVFSMGCVFFFVLTQGGHPFGPVKYSRELNVITGAYDLAPLETLGDVGILGKDLIQKMIQRQPKLR